MTFARLSCGGEVVRAADRADVHGTCAGSSHFLLAQKKAQKITVYRDTAPLSLKPVLPETFFLFPQLVESVN